MGVHTHFIHRGSNVRIDTVLQKNLLVAAADFRFSTPPRVWLFHINVEPRKPHRALRAS